MSVFNSRYNPRVPADFTASVRSSSGDWVAKVLNLSAGGMQVLGANGALLPGDLVEMRFRLLSGAQPIECFGEVVYHQGEQLGIRFAWLSPKERRLLERFLTQSIGEAWFV